MIINKKLIGHAFENSILIVSGLALYEILNILHRILGDKFPKRKRTSKIVTLFGNIFMIFIIDIVVIILLDEFLDTNIL